MGCCHPKRETDQGWAWLAFLASCIIHYMVFGMHYSFGILFPSLIKEFGEGEGKTAWVGSMASGSLFFWSILSVKLCGLTSVTFTCVAGAILSSLGLMLTSIIDNFHMLYLTHSFLFGLGTSLMYTPSLIVIARWFQKWRSMTTGVVVACGSLGQVVLSPMLQYFLERYDVWTTFRIWGAVFCGSTILSSCSFRVLEDGWINPSSQRSKFQLSLKLFRYNAYIIWLFIQMICNFTYYIPLIHLAYYTKRLGATSTESSLLLTSMGLSSILGRVFFGRISNLKPEWTCRVYQFAMFASGFSSVLFSFSEEYWHILSYVLIYGFLDGSFIGLLSIVTLEIVGLEDMAQGWGMLLFSIAAPIALGPACVGWMNDNQAIGSRSLFYFTGFPMILGSFLMFFVHRLKRKHEKAFYRAVDIASSILGLEESNNETKSMMQRITVL